MYKNYFYTIKLNPKRKTKVKPMHYLYCVGNFVILLIFTVTHGVVFLNNINCTDRIHIQRKFKIIAAPGEAETMYVPHKS